MSVCLPAQGWCDLREGRGGTLFHPGDVETAGDKGVGVGHLLDDLAGGLAGAVARLGVHQDEERVGLLGAAAHDVLQGGDVLERVQGHHAVVVVTRQQEHGGILDAIVLRDADVVERGVPAGGQRGPSRKEQTRLPHLCGRTSHFPRPRESL